MEAFIKRLQTEVQSKLNMVNPQASPVKGYDQKMAIVEWAITELQHHLITHRFPDKATEVNYFKHWLPSFSKQHIYFNALYKLESKRITTDTGSFSSYVEDERKRISDFLERHRELYMYNILKVTDRDEVLFVQTSFSGTGKFLTRNECFCQASLILSHLLAYEQYQIILGNELELLKKPKEELSDSEVTWDGTKAEAVELIVLLYESKLFRFNGQAASLDKLKELSQKLMRLDLKDFTVIDNNNRARKKSPNALLDKFNRVAKERMDRLNP